MTKCRTQKYDTKMKKDNLVEKKSNKKLSEKKAEIKKLK